MKTEDAKVSEELVECSSESDGSWRKVAKTARRQGLHKHRRVPQRNEEDKATEEEEKEDEEEEHSALVNQLISFEKKLTQGGALCVRVISSCTFSNVAGALGSCLNACFGVSYKMLYLLGFPRTAEALVRKGKQAISILMECS